MAGSQVTIKMLGFSMITEGGGLIMTKRILTGHVFQEADSEVEISM